MSLVVCDALEARHDRDRACRQGAGDAPGRNVDDPRPAVHRVGDDARLRPGERPRLHAQAGDRHREQRHRDPLPGSEQHVELAGRRHRADPVGEVDQLVGRVPHRGDHHDHLVAGLASGDDAPGYALDALRVSY